MGTIKIFFSLLNNKEKKNLAWQFLFILMAMFLETISIGIVLPVVQWIGGSVDKSNLIFKYISEFVPDGDKSSLIIVVSVFVVIVFFLKTIALAFISYKQAQFIYNTQAELSKKLFSSYLHRSYSFYLSNNTSHLIKNAITVVSQVTLSLISLMVFLSEIFVLLGIFIFLVYVEPKGTFYVSILMVLFSGTFYFVSRKYLKFYGNSYQINEGFKMQHLQQGFSAIKEIKISNKEEYFVNVFDVYNKLGARAGQFQQTFQALPRYFLEFVAIAALFFLIIFFAYNNYPIAEFVPIITIFGVAAFRMLPSFNRILNSLQNITYAKPAFEVLNKNINIEAESIERMNDKFTFTSSIKVRDLFFRYNDSGHYIIKNLSFDIPFGSCVGFVGKTGSGKSTMMDILLGLILPSKGQISIDGVNLNSVLSQWRNSIGYVPQTIYLLDDTIVSNIAFGLCEEEIDMNRISKAIHSAQLTNFIDSLADGLNTKVGERGVRLSGGQRQRIGIARALYNEPSILFMDEATSALDVLTENELINAINALRGKLTIVIVAHRKSIIESCDFLIDF